jgi:hypothetical protein
VTERHPLTFSLDFCCLIYSKWVNSFHTGRYVHWSWCCAWITHSTLVWFGPLVYCPNVPSDLWLPPTTHTISFQHLQEEVALNHPNNWNISKSFTLILIYKDNRFLLLSVYFLNSMLAWGQAEQFSKTLYQK